MYKISKEELRKYLLEKFSDEDLLKKLDELIEQVMREMQVKEINAQNIDEICGCIIKKYQDINKNNTKIEKKSGFSLFSLIMVLALGAGGGYKYHYFFDNRYSVDQEYSLLSTCVGYQGIHETKARCINKLKQCYEKGLKLEECRVW